jgi:hypothetical protein
MFFEISPPVCCSFGVKEIINSRASVCPEKNTATRKKDLLEKAITNSILHGLALPKIRIHLFLGHRALQE